MKGFVLLINLFVSTLVVAQGETPTLEQARAFLDKEDKTGFDFYNIYEDYEEFSYFSQKAEGEIIVSGTTIYKVVNHRLDHIQKFHCIQLEQTLTEKDAIELEKIIIKKYISGIPFAQLVEEYSINKNFHIDGLDMPIERIGKLGEEMQKHNVNEIFAVNDPVNNSYKVVIKNNNPAPRKAIFMWKAEYK